MQNPKIIEELSVILNSENLNEEYIKENLYKY